MYDQKAYLWEHCEYKENSIDDLWVLPTRSAVKHYCPNPNKLVIQNLKFACKETP
jgi:hypothetical protein